MIDGGTPTPLGGRQEQSPFIKGRKRGDGKGEAYIFGSALFASKPVFDVEMPATIAAGSKVWLTAFWFNARKETGPSSAPESTIIGEGPVREFSTCDDLPTSIPALISVSGPYPRFFH